MGVEAKLERLVRQTQAQARIPALTVALHRQDRPLWTFQVGTSGRAERPLDAGTRFRMGSVTKTFTAVLVLQCRDDGLLDLDDPVGKHLSVPAHGDLTVRRLLSHTSGVQREPYGDVWDTLRMPGRAAVPGRPGAGRTGPAAGAPVPLLERGLRHPRPAGRAPARRPGPRCWPTGSSRRSVCPMWSPIRATGPRSATWSTPYSDDARPEPPIDIGAIGPAGQLWSTAADLARWAAFLADPSTVDPGGAVLKESTLDEMRWPLTPSDETTWLEGFGLGPDPRPAGRAGRPRGPRRGHARVPGRRCTGAGRRPRPTAAGPGRRGAGLVGRRHRHGRPAAHPAADQRRGGSGRHRAVDAGAGAAAEVRARCWGGGGARASSSSSPGATGPCARGATWTRPTGHRPSSRRSARTSCAASAAARSASGCGCTATRHTGDVVRMNWATYRFTRTQETFEPH